MSEVMCQSRNAQRGLDVVTLACGLLVGFLLGLTAWGVGLHVYNVLHPAPPTPLLGSGYGVLSVYGGATVSLSVAAYGQWAARPMAVLSALIPLVPALALLWASRRHVWLFWMGLVLLAALLVPFVLPSYGSYTYPSPHPWLDMLRSLPTPIAAVWVCVCLLVLRPMGSKRQALAVTAVACVGLAMVANWLPWLLFSFKSDFGNSTTVQWWLLPAAALGLAALGYLAVRIALGRLPVVAPAELPAVIAVPCPRCRQELALRPDQMAQCPRCSLRMELRVSEPRCPKCSYLLHGLTSRACPECGTALNPEEIPGVLNSPPPPLASSASH